MTNSFLICGFPRSRTLWLSKFLTIPEVCVCTHEATEYAGSPKEFWANAEDFCSDSGAPIYGNSDCATIYVLPSVLAENPLCRTVWIARPIQEVCASMKAAKMPFDERTARTLIALRDEHKEYLDFTIDYCALNFMSGCRALWEFVLPGVPFDVGRWRQYANQRIAYTASNPPGPRETRKFLVWVREELTQWPMRA
jgi:hypothetical protein